MKRLFAPITKAPKPEPKLDGMNHGGLHNGSLHEGLLATGDDAKHVKAVQSIARKAGLSKSQIAMIK